jgi:hypothetical protein
MALGPYYLRRKSNIDLTYYVDSKEDALVMMKDLTEVLPLRHEGTKKRRRNEYKTWNQWFW